MKIIVPFEKNTDQALIDLLAACPTSWQGDQGFQNWCAALAEMASAPASAPVISSITPDTVAAGAPDTAITVAGTSFVEGAVVASGAGDLATTFTSATSLSATIPAAELANAATLNITVRNPDNQVSGPATFTVT